VHERRFPKNPAPGKGGNPSIKGANCG